MTKADFISEILKPEYKTICHKLIGNSYYKDLYQELTITALEYPEEKIRKIPNLQQARYFIVGILCRMAHSKTSPFYYKFRRNTIDFQEYSTGHYDIMDEDEHHKRLELVGNEISKEHWFDRELFKLYSDKSLSKISEETGINRSYIYSSISKTKEKIRGIMEKVRILLICSHDENGLKFHRQLSPHTRLVDTHPHISVTKMDGFIGPDNVVCPASIDRLTDEALRQFDIVYYLRNISPIPGSVERTIDRLHSLGIKVVFDIDDYWNLPEDHAMYQPSINMGWGAETEKALMLCDHIITTTDHLADKIRHLNSCVTVIPNCINPEDLQFKERKIESPRVRVGWIGGAHHEHDIALLGDAFCAISSDRELRNKIQLCLGGFNIASNGPSIYSVFEKMMTCDHELIKYDRTYYEYLYRHTKNMDHISWDKPYRRLWAKSVFNYGELYNEIDVALVPLRDDDFNNCKSELKIIEAGMMGKAVIVSDVIPYNKWINDGDNGILIKNNSGWKDAISYLVNNPEKRISMGRKLRATIDKHFNMDKWNIVREKLYKSLS